MKKKIKKTKSNEYINHDEKMIEIESTKTIYD